RREGTSGGRRRLVVSEKRREASTLTRLSLFPPRRMQPPPVASPFNQLPKSFDHALVLKAGFFAHFSLSSLVYLSKWTPNVYAYYNAFLVAGFWIACTTAHLDLTLIHLMGLEAVASLLDIFVIAIYYNGRTTKEGSDFYYFLAFLVHLLVRFGLLFAISRIRKERNAVGGAGADPMMRAEYQPVQSSMAPPPHQQHLQQQHVGYDYGQPTKMEPLPDISRFAPTNPYHQ
ncbi:hypothetical protein PMAYCL1PPCAC_30780, partial [Pristionchus mayeri]